jgi:hypothetical protein
MFILWYEPIVLVLPVLYCYDDQIMEDEMVWACGMCGDMINAYKILVANPEERRALGGLGRRMEDTIKMEFKELGCEGMNWIHLAQDRNKWRTIVKTVMNLRAS